MIVNFTLDYPQPYNKIGDGPEGPEVRTVADKLFPILHDKYICTVNVTDRAKLSGFEDFIYPCQIVNVTTHGKKIIIVCQNHFTHQIQKIIVSLGMTGRLQYAAGPHSHIHFELFDQPKTGFYVFSQDLYFDDTRYFGSVQLITDDSYFTSLGPDVLQHSLTTPLTLTMWKTRFTQKATYKNWPLCKALLDQSIVSGIGNYLVSEILYACELHPETKLGDLTDEEYEKLRFHAHAIIAKSYSFGGFTIESFISPDGTLGTYPAMAYGRKVDDLGNPIVAIKTSNGRTTYVSKALITPQ